MVIKKVWSVKVGNYIVVKLSGTGSMLGKDKARPMTTVSVSEQSFRASFKPLRYWKPFRSEPFKVRSMVDVVAVSIEHFHGWKERNRNRKSTKRGSRHCDNFLQKDMTAVFKKIIKKVKQKKIKCIAASGLRRMKHDRWPPQVALKKHEEGNPLSHESFSCKDKESAKCDSRHYDKFDWKSMLNQALYLFGHCWSGKTNWWPPQMV